MQSVASSIDIYSERGDKDVRKFRQSGKKKKNEALNQHEGLTNKYKPTLLNNQFTTGNLQSKTYYTGWIN